MRMLLALALALGAVAPAQGQLMDILTAPKTLVDRAIEARGSGDIVRDNAIVLKVNKVMAEIGSIKASTEIYEQRLLVTGLFDDKATHDKFKAGVHMVEGVKKLYWHAMFLTPAEQKSRKTLSWPDTTVMSTKAQARLVGTRGIADVNYRTAADPLGVVYIIGRARSAEEKRKALERARDGDGVKRVVDYVEVRP